MRTRNTIIRGFVLVGVCVFATNIVFAGAAPMLGAPLSLDRIRQEMAVLPEKGDFENRKSVEYSASDLRDPFLWRQPEGEEMDLEIEALPEIEDDGKTGALPDEGEAVDVEKVSRQVDALIKKATQSFYDTDYRTTMSLAQRGLKSILRVSSDQFWVVQEGQENLQRLYKAARRLELRRDIEKSFRERSARMKLEGIVYREELRSDAVINGKMYKVGEMVDFRPSKDESSISKSVSFNSDEEFEGPDVITRSVLSLISEGLPSVVGGAVFETKGAQNRALPGDDLSDESIGYKPPTAVDEARLYKIRSGDIVFVYMELKIRHAISILLKY